MLIVANSFLEDGGLDIEAEHCPGRVPTGEPDFVALHWSGQKCGTSPFSSLRIYHCLEEHSEEKHN